MTNATINLTAFGWQWKRCRRNGRWVLFERSVRTATSGAGRLKGEQLQVRTEAGISMVWRYDPDMPIDMVMRRWPSTIAVLIRHRMLCVGCPIATFYTIPEICAAHEIEEAQFIEELAASIAVRAQLGEHDHA